MDRATSFAKVSRRLVDAGLDVLTYDRAGYGSRVDEPPPAPRVLGDAADLLARLEERPAVAVGHSYGGHVALAAAVQRPDLVPAVAIYETPLAWADWWPPDTSGGVAVRVIRQDGGTPADAAETFMRSIVGDAVWERLPPSTRGARRAEGTALLADLLDIQGSAPYDPAAVRVPVVLGRGSESKGQHRLGSDAWQELLPDARLVVIDGAGHGGHSSHPDAFAAFVRSALGYAET